MIKTFILLRLDGSGHKWTVKETEVTERADGFAYKSRIHGIRILKHHDFNRVIMPERINYTSILLSIWCNPENVTEAKDKLMVKMREIVKDIKIQFDKVYENLNNLQYENQGEAETKDAS